ncbi:MAG TPA: hypothetical protein VG734_01840 [Lacunisphaera sp.]|nr:hypothetical protein [Lacunisphaera sp.]
MIYVPRWPLLLAANRGFHAQLRFATAGYMFPQGSAGMGMKRYNEAMATRATKKMRAQTEPAKTSKVKPTSAGRQKVITTVDPTRLAAAVAQLVALAAEVREATDPTKADHVDARLFRELHTLARTQRVLTSIIATLEEHRKEREKLVESVRAARSVQAILEMFPPKRNLPADAEAKVRKVVDQFGLDLTEGQVSGLLEAIQLQKEGDGQRARRAYNVIIEDNTSERTVWELVELAKHANESANNSPRPRAAGRVKTAAQMGIAWDDGIGASACLEYVLSVIGATTPDASRRALEAWNEALQAPFGHLFNRGS